MDEVKVRERLATVEAAVAGPQAQAELIAAVAASRAPYAGVAGGAEPAVELKFTVAETWAQKVLVALLMRRGFRPYRKRGQHATTLMVVAPPTFVKETIMAEYAAITGKLESWIDTVADRVVAEVIGVDDIAVVRGE
jgi:hypothetical protein